MRQSETALEDIQYECNRNSLAQNHLELMLDKVEKLKKSTVQSINFVKNYVILFSQIVQTVSSYLQASKRVDKTGSN